MSHVVAERRSLDTPCWVCSYTGPRGYTTIKVAGKTQIAHRFAYEELVGPIPKGLDLDHLCRVRNCVNPAHLEPVTRRVNLSRGMGQSAVACRTGLCKRGHSLANAYVRPNGRRDCRECANTRVTHP